MQLGSASRQPVRARARTEGTYGDNVVVSTVVCQVIHEHWVHLNPKGS